jgi:hypothetical protein
MQIGESLAKIPEVAGWLKDHGCIVGEDYSDRPEEWGKFTIHARGIPLSAILDEIGAKSRTYFWGAAINSAGGRCVISLKP